MSRRRPSALRPQPPAHRGGRGPADRRARGGGTPVGAIPGQLRVLPGFQGQGWGTRILDDLLRQAKETGVPLTLQVLRVNAGARRLYERLGLRVIEETPTHYRMSTTSGRA
jgi:GNAT superfamily N-acetyltransferase